MNPHDDASLRLFPNCRLVRGASHSAVYDLERRKLFRFSNHWLPLIESAAEPDGLRLAHLDSLDQSSRDKCDPVLDFLNRNELVYRADQLPAGGALSDPPMAWHAPHRILNAVVDVDQVDHDWPTLLRELEALGARSLQIRAFSSRFDLSAARDILETIQASQLSHIYLLLRWSPEHQQTPWRDLFDRFGNLVAIELHSSPTSELLSGARVSSLPARTVAFRTDSPTSASGCGRIDKKSLSLPNVRMFAELQSFNGCLNRKVAVRADGQICNCPSLKTTYGSDLGALSEIVSTVSFQRSWHLRKDAISVCKECEYRYVCTDCRAHLESDLSTGKPARCGYDPRTGLWESTAAETEKAWL